MTTIAAALFLHCLRRFREFIRNVMTVNAVGSLLCDYACTQEQPLGGSELQVKKQEART